MVEEALMLLNKGFRSSVLLEDEVLMRKKWYVLEQPVTRSTRGYVPQGFSAP